MAPRDTKVFLGWLTQNHRTDILGSINEHVNTRSAITVLIACANALNKMALVVGGKERVLINRWRREHNQIRPHSAKKNTARQPQRLF